MSGASRASVTIPKNMQVQRILRWERSFYIERHAIASGKRGASAMSKVKIGLIQASHDMHGDEPVAKHKEAAIQETYRVGS